MRGTGHMRTQGGARVKSGGHDAVFHPKRITVLDGLRQLGSTSFRKLIRHACRTDLVTFLAMLELIKQHIIQANQTAVQ